MDEEKNESKQKNEVNSKIYEDFASFQKNNEEDNNEILGEIELLNPKPQKKLRYPNLEVATKNIGENNENFKEDKIFFSENPFQEDSKQYKSLKEKKSDFTSFLSNLGWKSKSYLKSFDNHKGGSKEIELKFRYKQDLIKCLNAKICDFKDSETFLKGNIEKFRLEEKKRDNLFSKTKIDSYNSIEKKWIEKINILKSTEKEKKDNLDFDLKYILKNSKMKNKLY